MFTGRFKYLHFIFFIWCVLDASESPSLKRKLNDFFSGASAEQTGGADFFSPTGRVISHASRVVNKFKKTNKNFEDAIQLVEAHTCQIESDNKTLRGFLEPSGLTSNDLGDAIDTALGMQSVIANEWQVEVKTSEQAQAELSKLDYVFGRISPLPESFFKKMTPLEIETEINAFDWKKEK